MCKKLSGDVWLEEGTVRKDNEEARTLLYGGLRQAPPRTLFGACCTNTCKSFCIV